MMTMKMEKTKTEEQVRKESKKAESDKKQDVKPDTDKPKRSKPKTVLLIGLIVVLVGVITAGGVGLGRCIYQYLYESTGSSTVVADDIYVNDIAIGGMSMDEARAMLTDIEKDMAAQVKVDVKIGKKTQQLTQKDFPCSFDTDEVFEEIKAYSAEKGFDKEEQRYTITMMTDTSGIGRIAEKIAEEVYVEPEDARVSKFSPDADNMFTYQEEKTGQQLDKDDLIKKLKAVFKDGKVSGTVKAEIDAIEPSMTADYLRGNIKKLASYSTESTNNENGNHNMKISLKACNGSIIEPGETWSFNDHTGDSNLESNGYKEAGVIVDGKTGTGIGGGICQSSTTIYNAGILSGMGIEERYCHYYKSTYVDAGRDATIDYGNLDLKLSNPFSYQLFMKCWMSGTKLTCEIYGLPNSEFDQIKVTTSDPEQKKDSYTVKAWRTYYLDGEKVKKEELPESTYYTK